MVWLTNLTLFALLTTCALAAPVPYYSMSSIDWQERGAKFQCPNAAGNIEISMDEAVKAMNSSPATPDKSGYPHTFQNFSKIKFKPDQCNGGHLLEFPVPTLTKDDETKPDRYDAQKHHPKQNPGAVRVIFIAENQPGPHKIFCGVVAHVGEGTNANAGQLQLCN